MIPLRRILIVDAHEQLPYPEGTACAEVLQRDRERDASWRMDLLGDGAGRCRKTRPLRGLSHPLNGFGGVPLLPKAEIAFELAPALLGVGYILGYRQSGVLVAGSIVSALALTPLIAIVGMHLGTPLAPEPASWCPP